VHCQPVASGQTQRREEVEQSEQDTGAEYRSPPPPLPICAQQCREHAPESYLFQQHGPERYADEDCPEQVG